MQVCHRSFVVFIFCHPYIDVIFTREIHLLLLVSLKGKLDCKNMEFYVFICVMRIELHGDSINKLNSLRRMNLSTNSLFGANGKVE